MISNMYGITNDINNMIDNRIFSPDSVDAVLQDTSTKLTLSSLQLFYGNDDFNGLMDIQKIVSSRKILYMLSKSITANSQNDYEKVQDILNFVSHISDNFPLKEQNNEKIYKTPNDYFWGGTEEILIFKGTDWCSEIARVFCAICQCENIPTRIVYTFSDFDGHVINEVFVSGKWLLVDSTNGFIYVDKNGKFLSLPDLVFNEVYRKIELQDYSKYYYSNHSYFKHVFLNYYWISNYEQYNYKLNFCNEYYKNVLESVWNQSEGDK